MRHRGRLAFAVSIAWAAAAATAHAEEPAVDLVTFATGLLPVSAAIDGKDQGADFEGLVRASDGDPERFPLVRNGTPSTVAELVYELPALTTFASFAVPRVAEVPSKFITFVHKVEVLGSSAGPAEGFALLASAELKVHTRKDQLSELTLVGKPVAVRWIKVRVSGGLSLPSGKGTLQFSELIGRGKQEATPQASHFTGVWKGRGVLIELRQAGTTVWGCYDSDGGHLTGTVSGNILRAVGVDPGDKVPSSFVLAVGGDGGLRGLRSTNRAPFRVHQAPRAPAGTRTKCSEAPPPKLGCGAVIHAITFDFDSAALRADSAAVLGELHTGLAGEADGVIIIEGHTSSEGAAAHNLDLSKRRAQAVVDDLVRRGLDRKRLRAAGKGPSVPIAPNTDENGRALNRRVEVKCVAR